MKIEIRKTSVVFSNFYYSSSCCWNLLQWHNIKQTTSLTLQYANSVSKEQSGNGISHPFVKKQLFLCTHLMHIRNAIIRALTVAGIQTHKKSGWTMFARRRILINFACPLTNSHVVCFFSSYGRTFSFPSLRTQSGHYRSRRSCQLKHALINTRVHRVTINLKRHQNNGTKQRVRVFGTLWSLFGTKNDLKNPMYVAFSRHTQTKNHMHTKEPPVWWYHFEIITRTHSLFVSWWPRWDRTSMI